MYECYCQTVTKEEPNFGNPNRELKMEMES